MRRISILALATAALCAVPLCAEEGVLRYVQAHGAASSAMQIEVSRSPDGMMVKSEAGGRSEESLWVPGRGTISWQLTDPAAASDIHAERTGDMIRVTGRLKGREVTRELRVDAAPWYQIFGPGIADLLSPDAARMEFWVVNPDAWQHTRCSPGRQVRSTGRSPAYRWILSRFTSLPRERLPLSGARTSGTGPRTLPGSFPVCRRTAG